MCHFHDNFIVMGGLPFSARHSGAARISVLAVALFVIPERNLLLSLPLPFPV